MEYAEFVAKKNVDIAAGNVITSLQEGEEVADPIICSLLKRTYELYDGNKGDLLCLAIQTQKYVAAIQLMDYNTLSTDEEIVESLNLSIENFHGEEDLKLLQEESKGDIIHEKMIVEKTANLRALNILKERYLGNQRVR